MSMSKADILYDCLNHKLDTDDKQVYEYLGQLYELADRVEKSTSIFHQQAEFMKAGEVPIKTEDWKDVLLSMSLVEEEFDEWIDEWMSYGTLFPDSINVNDVKECLDLIYTAAQYLNTIIGPDLASTCFNALHDNNMSKCTDGKLVKREDGKVLKPEGYKKLDLTPLLEELL